jgi:hypothetical protein
MLIKEKTNEGCLNCYYTRDNTSKNCNHDKYISGGFENYVKIGCLDSNGIINYIFKKSLKKTLKSL